MYGWKLLTSALIDVVYNNARQLIIGKKYSSEDLAYYNKGDQFPHLIVTNINTSIDSVLFPTMSKAQDDKASIRSMVRRAIMTSTYLMAPMMIGLAVIAESVVKFVLTDNWLFCVPFMQIFCIEYMFYPIHTANLNAIKAVGRSDLFLKLEITKKCFGLAILLSSMWFGVKVMALSLLISTAISMVINSWPNRKILNYGLLKQLKDIIPNLLLAALMGVFVWLVGLIPMNYIILMFIQIFVGVLIYIAGSILLKNETFFYLLNMIKGLRKRTNKKEKLEMKLGIMQPYFVPYIGYWQLMAAVDKYVIYDDVNFIKGGWINRNKILVNGNPSYFNVPMIGASPNKLINEVQVNTDERLMTKNLKTIHDAYAKAPFFDEVYPLIEKIVTCNETNLALYLANSIKLIANYLDMNTEFILSSELDKDCSLKAQDKVVHICKKLGATEYFNAIGGQELYDYDSFEKEGLKLKFVETDEIVYTQFNNEFQPNLSIIDVLMFNSKDEVKKMLNKYTLKGK